jgi:heme/copper-type cytochrome/quinol oxidase subunit 2
MFAGGEILLVLAMLVLVLPLALAALVFWVWMLVSACQNQGLTDGERIAWVLVLVFVHILGAIFYFLIAHPKRNTPLPPPKT